MMDIKMDLGGLIGAATDKVGTADREDAFARALGGLDEGSPRAGGSGGSAGPLVGERGAGSDLVAGNFGPLGPTFPGLLGSGMSVFSQQKLDDFIERNAGRLEPRSAAAQIEQFIDGTFGGPEKGKLGDAARDYTMFRLKAESRNETNRPELRERLEGVMNELVKEHGYERQR